MNKEHKRTGGWTLLFPWLLASLVASLVPALLSLLDVNFRSVISDATTHYAYGFGPIFPLGAKSFAYVLITTITFWGVGFVFMFRQLPLLSRKSDSFCYLSLTLALAMLLFIAPMLSTAWTLAITSGNTFFESWGNFQGNHGPWRHAYDLTKILSSILLFPFWSFGLGLLSFIIKRSRLAILVLTGSIVVFLLLFGSHYWLID